MKTMDFKLTNIDDIARFLSSDMSNMNFVAYERENSIEFYFGSFDETPELNHKYVADKYKLDRSKILGGGTMQYIFKEIICNDSSIAFGPVPNSAAEQLVKTIAFTFKKAHPVEKAEIEMFYDHELRKRGTWPKAGRWEYLGYKFDRNKREITLS